MPLYLWDYEVTSEDAFLLAVAVFCLYLYRNPQPQLAMLPGFAIPLIGLAAAGLVAARVYANQGHHCGLWKWDREKQRCVPKNGNGGGGGVQVECPPGQRYSMLSGRCETISGILPE